MTASRGYRLWHPFADMSTVPGREVTIVRGEGCYVFDAADRRYLDASASLWYCNVGHGRHELAEAAAAQMRELAGFHTFDVYANRPATRLARRLAEMAPAGDGAAVFLTSGGSEALDTAAKLVRLYWSAQGQPERRLIVARRGAYHGMAAFGTSLAGISDNRRGWGPLIEDVIHVPYDDAAALGRVLDDHAGSVAAVFGEPVLGAAGIYPPAERYWQQVEGLCRERDVLLVADEVVTGFGRLGQAFASARYGIGPDVVCGAKGVTSGYAPLGFVVVGDRVRARLWHPNVGRIRHGYTYSGHPTACAVALANLDLLEAEDLYGRVRQLEPHLAASMGALEDHELIDDVRTVGLLAGVEIAADARSRWPGFTELVVEELRRRGVLLRNLLGHTLQVSPPFVITPEEVDSLTAAIRGAVEAVADGLEAGAGRASGVGR